MMILSAGNKFIWVGILHWLTSSIQENDQIRLLSPHLALNHSLPLSVYPTVVVQEGAMTRGRHNQRGLHKQKWRRAQKEGEWEGAKAQEHTKSASSAPPVNICLYHGGDMCCSSWLLFTTLHRVITERHDHRSDSSPLPSRLLTAQSLPTHISLHRHAH